MNPLFWGGFMPLAGKKILVAEDNALQATDMAAMVASARGLSACAASIKQVIEAVEREKFDGVLLDVLLRDGLSTQVVRQLEHDHIPFILVSGYGPEGLPREVRGAPYIAKPFARDQLINLMTKHFARPNAG